MFRAAVIKNRPPGEQDIGIKGVQGRQKVG
jgi:hypothetical protein